MGPSVSATFIYDGDGKRVKSTINSVTTSFVGSHYEVSGTTVTKYYFAGASRIAMRTGSTLTYLLSDHLGSTSLSTDASGNLISELRYTAWGSTRYSNGTTQTNYTYTGQYSNVSDFGLMYYGARWYDNSLGRFAQADSIVPGGVQGYDRYAYVNNNPVKYTDPTGHCSQTGDNWCFAENGRRHRDPGDADGDSSGFFSFDGGWNDPKYSTWNLLRMGSPCAACHVTHDQPGDWGIPTNNEMDLSVATYNRSMDGFAKGLHIYGLSYAGYVATEAIEMASIGNKGYAYLSKSDYDDFGKNWGGNKGYAFVTDEVGAAAVRQQTSVSGINDVLGTNFKNGSTIIEVEIPNIHSSEYNLSYPSSGNGKFIPGGYTIGGVPERIIDPINLFNYIMHGVLP